MAPNRTKALVAAFADVNSTIKGTASSVAGQLRSVDLASEGLPDASQALTKAKNLGGAIAGTAGTVGSNVTGFFKTKKKKQSDEDIQGEELAGENDATIVAE
jgi:hypothetical protein